MYYIHGDIFENVDYVQFGKGSSTSCTMSVNFEVPANQSEISDLIKFSPVAHSIL